jgi:hypothetical protein
VTYQRKTGVKISRITNLYKKIGDGTKKQAEDAKNGLEYKSGMVGPHASKEGDTDAG